MEQTGYIGKLRDRLLESGERIELGRKALFTPGQEANGRIAFVAGVMGALETFKEIQAIRAPEVIVSAEKLFVQQDIHFCDPSDGLTIKMLERSLNYLNDSLRSIEVLKQGAYVTAEATHPTEHRQKRGDVPKDVVHNACNINAARLDQYNRTYGLPMIEKELTAQS